MRLMVDPWGLDNNTIALMHLIGEPESQARITCRHEQAADRCERHECLNRRWCYPITDFTRRLNFWKQGWRRSYIKWRNEFKYSTEYLAGKE